MKIQNVQRIIERKIIGVRVKDKIGNKKLDR